MDRVDWEKRSEKRRGAKVSKISPDLRQAAQAIPAMEALTGLTHWDVFLSLLQGMIEEREKDYDGMREQFLDLDALEYPQLMRLKIESIQVRQSIQTLKEIMELPKVLIEEGRKARGLLKRYGLDAG